jgi:hypothetical protein
MESYAKSDSDFGIAENDIWLNEVINDVVYNYVQDKENYEEEKENTKNWLYENGVLYWGKNVADYAFLGPNDLDLAQRMIKAGSPNDKFLRQIFVSVDITAPLYFWKELDTYKVATVANSTSTMHKLASTPITKECFEMDDYNGSLKLYDREPYNIDDYVDDMWDSMICCCETLRQRYLETKDMKYWKELIRVLPESWLQTRTWSANYSTLRGIIHWRRGHKLSEWAQFIDWTKSLPYSSELLFYNQEN